MLGVELLARSLEVVDHREDLGHGGTGDLQLQVLLVAALALAVVVEISRNAHVLTSQALVLGLKGGELPLQLPQWLLAGRGLPRSNGLLARIGLSGDGRAGIPGSGTAAFLRGRGLPNPGIGGELWSRAAFAAHAAARGADHS